jgi:hypothetical protein
VASSLQRTKASSVPKRDDPFLRNISRFIRVCCLAGQFSPFWNPKRKHIPTLGTTTLNHFVEVKHLAAAPAAAPVKIEKKKKT